MMLVAFEFHDVADDTSHREIRRVVRRRRDGWLPPVRHRESIATPILTAWRDYILDRRASAERGVLVYRQMDPQEPWSAA